jgi:hypothetical protein
MSDPTTTTPPEDDDLATHIIFILDRNSGKIRTMPSRECVPGHNDQRMVYEMNDAMQRHIHRLRHHGNGAKVPDKGLVYFETNTEDQADFIAEEPFVELMLDQKLGEIFVRTEADGYVRCEDDSLIDELKMAIERL